MRFITHAMGPFLPEEPCKQIDPTRLRLHLFTASPFQKLITSQIGVQMIMFDRSPLSGSIQDASFLVVQPARDELNIFYW